MAERVRAKRRGGPARIAILLCVLGLLAAACGGGESGDTTTTAGTDTTVATTEAPDTTEADGATSTTVAMSDEPAMSFVDAGLEPLEARIPLSIQFNSAIPFNLPFMWAIDQGYFDAVGIDLDAQTERVPYSQNLPRLVTGDLDILVGGNPAPLYNQMAQGFGAQLAATNGIPHEGRVEPIVLGVRADLADEITELSDLEGVLIESAGNTSGGWVLAALAIQEAGLVDDEDVTIGSSIKSIADMLAVAEAQVAEVIVMSEPTATQAENLGYIQKWVGFTDVAPWREATYITMSADSIANKHDAMVKFLEVYLLACREIEASEGEWTPELIDTMTKWSGQDEATVTAAGLIPFFEPNGAINIEGLDRIQQLFIDNDLVETPVDVTQMVAQDVIDQALATVGRVEG